MVNGNGDNNNISKKRLHTAENIIIALKETHGLLTMAARKAGVSYPTINRYVHDFPSVKEAVDEAKSAMLDFAEGKLFQKISDGDTACIIFYLKTQGKKLGYIEKQEQSIDVTSLGQSIKPDRVDFPADIVRESNDILLKAFTVSTPNPN
jgi:hypothetical protein